MIDLLNSKFVQDGNPAPANGQPRLGDRAMRQQRRPMAFGGPMMSQACGVLGASGDCLQPAAYPYWRMMLWGSDPVYRLMENQATIALALYTVCGPVRASVWDYTYQDDSGKIVKGDDDPAVRWLKDEILPLRRKTMRHAVRAVPRGWQPFSIGWEIRDGMYVPCPRPLLSDATFVLQDDNGHYAGLTNQGDKGDPVRFSDLESWAPSLDGEADYAYGRARLENIRTTAWAPWLTTQLRLKDLEEKIAGIIPIVRTAPDGDPENLDESGNHVSYAKEGDTVLNELPKGRGVRLTGLLDARQILEAQDASVAKALLDYTPVQIDFYDAGNVAQAVTGFIAAAQYYDKLMFRGMLRGERAGLEAVAAGSRADSEQHTETGAADSEAIDADLTESADESWVRTALRLNFGEEKARRIHIISTPLQEWKKQVYRELLTRLVSIPDIAVSVAKSLDMSAIFSQMSLPEKKEFVFEAIQSGANPPADSGLQPVKQPPMNGNTTAAVNRLAEALHTMLAA